MGANDWRSFVKKTFADLKKTNPNAMLKDALKKAGPLWKDMKSKGQVAVDNVTTTVKTVTKKVKKGMKMGKKKTSKRKSSKRKSSKRKSSKRKSSKRKSGKK
jgi:hypothetical protein